MTDSSSYKRGGLSWFVRRIRQEYYCPTRTWSAAGINAFLDMRASVLRPFTSKAANPVAVYDLRYCPNTFDFAYFLYDAETYFRELGFDRFNVCILDKEQVGLGEYENVIGWEKRRKRVKAMLVPMVEMYQGCSSVRVTDDADELIELCKNNEPIFPRRADGRHLRRHEYVDIYRKLGLRIPFSGFRAPQSAVDQVVQFKKRLGITQPCVTLTVRAYPHQPLRNTNVDVYFRFAEHLRAIGFVPIFIPDADDPTAVNFRDFLSFEDACSDLYLRTAMYEASYTNVFTSNGVHAMAGFNNKCSFMIAMLNEHYPASTGTKRWEAEGLKIGDQFFGGATKHIVWAKETFENLCEYLEITRSNLPVNVVADQQNGLKDFA